MTRSGSKRDSYRIEQQIRANRLGKDTTNPPATSERAITTGGMPVSCAAVDTTPMHGRRRIQRTYVLKKKAEVRETAVHAAWLSLTIRCGACRRAVLRQRD